MPKRSIGEIFDDIKDASSKAERIALLKKHNSPSLRTYLRIAYDPIVESFLPKGKPKFKERNVPFGLGDSSLDYESKRMYLFVGVNGNPSHPSLKQARREVLFVQVIEALDNKEREYIVQIKDKTLDLGLTTAAINEAIPGLISVTSDELPKTKETKPVTPKPTTRTKVTKPKEESPEDSDDATEVVVKEAVSVPEKPAKKKTTRKKRAPKKTAAKKESSDSAPVDE